MYVILHASRNTGPEVDRLAAMAGKYKVYLVMGVIERDGYTLYCTVLFFLFSRTLSGKAQESHADSIGACNLGGSRRENRRMCLARVI